MNPMSSPDFELWEKIFIAVAAAAVSATAIHLISKMMLANK